MSQDNYRTALNFLLFFLLMIVATSQEKEIIDTTDLQKFKEKHLENQVLSQYHRWFLAFEKDQNKARIANHLEILSDSVDINTIGGAMKGTQGMLGFLNFVKDWKNAHHILSTEVHKNKDGTIHFEADIVYQNILPDGKKNNNELHYSTQLQYMDGELPIFTSLELLPTKSLDSLPFKDAYTDNRIKSFIYYWSYLMDNLALGENKVEELLANEIDLQFPTKTVKSHAEFRSTLTEIKNSLATSLHTPENIEAELQRDGTLKVSFDFDWKGITMNGDRLIAKFHHNWILENNPDERYARIRKIRIEPIVPIRLAVEFEY